MIDIVPAGSQTQHTILTNLALVVAGLGVGRYGDCYLSIQKEEGYERTKGFLE